MELTGGNIRKVMITCSPRRKFYLGMAPLVQRFERMKLSKNGQRYIFYGSHDGAWTKMRDLNLFDYGKPHKNW
jgi:hypothetical protein